MFAARGGFFYSQVGQEGYISIVTSGDAIKVVPTSTGSASYITFTEGTGNIGLMKFNNTGTLQWAKRLSGSSTTELPTYMVMDSSENLYISGSTTQSGLGGSDMLVVKYDNTGSVLWQKALGTSGTDRNYTVAIDSSGGNIFVGGRGNTDSVVSNYTSSGTLSSQNTLGGTIGVADIFIDSSDNVYTYAYETSDVSVNGMIIIKWNSTLSSSTWVRRLSDATDTNSLDSACAVDSGGNVYVTVHNNSNDNQYIVKYNSSGTLQWQKEISQNNNGLDSICVDSTDHIYVIGQNTDTTKPVWFAKLDSSGAFVWQRYIYNSTNACLANEISWANGYVYIAGAAGTNSLVAKLPDDGSGTGTYGGYVYGTTAYTLSTSTLTSSSSTANKSTLSDTEVTPTLTNSTITPTQTLYTV